MRRHPSLPEGASIEDYAGWESWHYREWAWQYLRRNEDFQKSCLDLSKTTSQLNQKQQEIAEFYFLKKFKHFSEKTLKSNEGFTAIITKSKKPVDTENFNFEFELKHHEIAFVIDLRIALHSSDGIKAQLEIIKSILENRVDALKKTTTDQKAKSSPKVSREIHLHRLRVFDLHKSGMTWKEIADISDIGDKRIPLESMIERLRKDREAALDLINFGYIALVTSTRSREKMPLASSS